MTNPTDTPDELEAKFKERFDRELEDILLKIYERGLYNGRDGSGHNWPGARDKFWPQVQTLIRIGDAEQRHRLGKQ